MAQSKTPKGSASDAPETDVQIAQRLWSDSELRDIGSFEEVAQSFGSDLESSTNELGSGFVVLDDKDLLLKVPFIMLEWRFNEGKYLDAVTGEKRDFVSITLITKSGDKWILNDGSTGIAAQMRDYSDRKGKYSGMYCPMGLRVSRDYEVILPDGTKTLGTTYYVA